MKRWIYTTLTLATFGVAACEDGTEAPLAPDLGTASTAASHTVVSPELARSVLQSRGDRPYYSIAGAEEGGDAGAESCVALDFEGIPDATQVGTLAGAVTAAFGTSWYAIVDVDDGGSGDFANEPSSMTAATQMDLGDVDIVLDQPVTSVSLSYSAASETLPITLLGLDGDGATVASAEGTTVGFDLFGSLCTGDPNGSYCAWDVLEVSTVEPLIQTVRLTGVGSAMLFIIDDMVLCGAGGPGGDPPPVEDNVSIDIKPGSDENPVNPSAEGKLPVALFGSEELDVSSVDLESLTLGDGVDEDTPLARKGGDQPMAQVVELNDDGFPDLMLHFDVGEMVENGDLTWETTELVLMGSLLPEVDETTASTEAAAVGEEGGDEGSEVLAEVQTLRGTDFVRVVGGGGEADGDVVEGADVEEPSDRGQGQKKGHDKGES
jgi:hypothetical protein